MGREIRRVPKGWEHPKDESGFIAMYDEDYDSACREWWVEACQWHRSMNPDKENEGNRKEFPWYWDWDGNPPDKKSYRSKFKEKVDCYQIYETVSEGTPVSPVFSSKEEMIEWMIQPIDRQSDYNRGEDWQCMQAMTPIQAEKFIENGHAFTLIVTPETGLVAGHRFEQDDK